MTRRRLSAGLPSNTRYPFTPDNDRESFIDYEIHDGNGNYSREHVTYPVYRPRDESPAPQIVRIAKQPEMIRRQSVRSSSGHWGTLATNSLPGESKVPGSFQDTDGDFSNPELDRETIEPIPTGMAPYGYSHPTEIVDFYSDISDDDLDVEQDHPMAFPQLPIEGVFHEMAYILRMKSNPTGEGFTYVFADPTGRSKFYKIGSSKNVSKRANEHRSICKLSMWGVKRKPAIPVREYKRLEKLSQSELMNLNYDPNCICETQGREYFYGREQTAFEILEFWAKWLMKQSPYTKDGLLLPFWDHRLKFFEANLSKYFNCGSTQCAKRARDAIACQACLRAGWKAWADPTRLEKVEFSSRTQIGIEWVHNLILYIHKYIPIRENISLACIDGVGWTISTWDRFKNPTLLLNIMYARLVIPMIWSSIFTANEYIPAFTILEMALFFMIYQLVRSELPDVFRNQADSNKKLPRPPIRKALPSTVVLDGGATTVGANVGRVKKQSKLIDIPDDRFQNIIERAATQVKGASKKMDPISIIPAETTARLKKFRTGRRKSDIA